MATTDCTLGTRFAESKFLAKTYSFHPTEAFSPGFSPVFDDTVTDETLAGLMEALRVQAVIIYQAVLCLDIEVQKRSRLLRSAFLSGAGEIESLLRALRLLTGSGVDLDGSS